jgi:RHS repeat-associated protein
MIDSSGATVVEYVYDSWGNIVSSTGSLASTVGIDQPFRYRGYVYDEETELYYLQSRYYDPKIGRFISADVYLSTAQGVIGNNSFVYCFNNPIISSDCTGTFPVFAFLVAAAVVITIGLTASGCTLIQGDDMDIAYPDYLKRSKKLNTDKAKQNDYNCMGYAFDIESNCMPDGYFDGISSDDFCDCLLATFGDGIRKLSSINDSIRPDEYMIAINCSENDFHFMKRTDNGMWYEKCGIEGPLQQVSVDYVNSTVWESRRIQINNRYKDTPTYYSGTRFLAVKKDWRKYLK